MKTFRGVVCHLFSVMSYVKEFNGRLETQAVAGRWRSMTRAHSQEVRDPNHWVKYTMNQLSKTFLVAGFEDLEAEGQLGKLKERVIVIIKLALQVQNAVAEAITSMDLEPFTVDPGTLFDPDYMEDSYAGNDNSDATDEPIIATTELGLGRRCPRMVFLKPKVILRSALEI
jgi:hypothetical protein